MAGEKIPILEIMDRYGVDLIEQGDGDSAYHKGCCPLHDESNPSFVVYPNSGRWVCFAGCGSGDVIDFVMKKEGCSYKTALETATTELSAVDALLRECSKVGTWDTPVDVDFLKRRTLFAFDKLDALDIEDVHRVLYDFDCLMENNRWLEADTHLRKHGL